MNNYDVIVIGAGHAGIEAAVASARMGCSVLVMVLNRKTSGLMSCNPAIGGVGKGQLVKEIDALGGVMGLAADACGIQFRILNASKGQAVRSSRAQIDSAMYNRYMVDLLDSQKNLTVIEVQAKGLLVEEGVVTGVITEEKGRFLGKTVVICTGTFLDGLIHVGLTSQPGGRIGEPASVGLAGNLKDIGFNILRFKTGTCARLDKNSIDCSSLIEQKGDCPPSPFSFSTKKIKQEQRSCYITYTNHHTHKIIKDNLDRSPLYSGKIQSAGVRYCPSIEDKIVKFGDKERHQVFLEPEGLDTDLVYPNGLSTSLPEDVQLEMIHSIKGLERARIIRYGYGIEHSVVEPTQLYPTLETKFVRNLYTAGQINGTTGYEEAAAQGIVAGINAALRVQNKEPFVLDRAGSYIGVLIDDLTTKGTTEPYRMFTSRVEYRLILREDNADLRLRKLGYKLGLVSKKDYESTLEKQRAIDSGIRYLRSKKINPTQEINLFLKEHKSAQIKKVIFLQDLLKRPEISLKDLILLADIGSHISEIAYNQIEIEVKYDGFIKRQLKDVERFEHLEKIRLPVEMDYTLISALSREIREKLNRFRPINLGQASRISGVTPAAISILMVYLRKTNG